MYCIAVLCVCVCVCVCVCDSDPSCPKCFSPPSHPFRKSQVSRMWGATSPLSLQPDPCSWEPFQTSPILSYKQVQDPRLSNQCPSWVPYPSHPQGICLLYGAVPPLGFSRPPLWDDFNILWILLFGNSPYLRMNSHRLAEKTFSLWRIYEKDTMQLNSLTLFQWLVLQKYLPINFLHKYLEFCDPT